MIFVTSMDPSPSPSVMLAAYGTLFSSLCREMGGDEMALLSYLRRHYDMEMVSAEEFKAHIRRESN